MIIIAGCGYLGGRLADAWHEQGHAVLGLARTGESAQKLAAAKPWRVEVCDVSERAAVASLAEKTGPGAVRAVIHCASSGRGGADAYRSVYLDGMRHLLGAFPQAFAVFTSSTSVYAQTDGSTVTEDSEAAPGRETGRILRETEDLVLAAGGAVLRLAGIYGPDRWHVLRALLEGEAAIEGGDGQGRILNQIHRDDAAAAVMHVIGKRAPGILNVSDDQPMAQRQCLEQLAARFALPVPPAVPPNPDRKRGWTSKRVSNARLKAAGWSPSYPSCLAAFERDPLLVSSILAQVESESPGALPRKTNIVLVGLMGSGKTAVGKLAAKRLGFRFTDTDQLIVQSAGQPIPRIFEKEGEPAFRERESAALRSLLSSQHCVIATGGGIVTQERNHPLLRHLGCIVWLDAGIETLHRRTGSGRGRPLLKGQDPKARLQSLMDARRPLYQQLADLRIQSDELTLDETAYGLVESARHYFGG